MYYSSGLFYVTARGHDLLITKSCLKEKKLLIPRIEPSTDSSKDTYGTHIIYDTTDGLFARSMENCIIISGVWAAVLQVCWQSFSKIPLHTGIQSVIDGELQGLEAL